MANPFDTFDKNPFDEFDKAQADDHKSNKILTNDLPLGLLETATTGAVQAIGGSLAKGIGGIAGALIPGQTAEGLGNKFSEGFNSATEDVLNPQTESGKAIMESIGNVMTDFQDFYKTPENVRGVLGAIPFLPKQIGDVPQIQAATSGLAQALPELSVLAPMLKGTTQAKPIPKGIDFNKLVETSKAEPLPTDLFPETLRDTTGHTTPYNAGEMGISYPVTPKRARAQTELQLGEDRPIHMDREGVSIPPEQFRAVDIAKDSEVARMDAMAKEQLDASFLNAKQQEMWATDHPGDLAKSGEMAPKEPVPELTKQGDWVGDREVNRDYTDLRASDGAGGERPFTRAEFETTVNNLAKEPGTKYELPVNLDEAYSKYLDQVSSKQTDMFDIGSRQEAFKAESFADQVARQLEEHPFVKKAEKELAKQEQFVADLKAQVESGTTRATALVSELKALEKAQAKVATVRSNVETALTNKTAPSPFKGRGRRQAGGILIDWGKKKEADVLKGIPGVEKFVGEMKQDVRPFEQFLKEEAGSKDLDQNILQKIANYGTKGAVYMALKTGNPIIRRVGDTMLEAANSAKSQIADIVHSKLAPASQALSKVERTEAWAAQQLASKTKQPLTEARMREVGFNEKQIKWVLEHTEAMKYSLAKMNEAVAAGEMSPITPEIAYLASRASGDFRRLIYKEVNGERTPVAILGANSRWRLNSDKAKLEALHPEWIVGEERYFGGGNKRATDGMKQTIELLSKNNPDVALLAQHMNDVLTKDAMDYMGAKTHTMHKKGIDGMVGNKQFESAFTNAKEGMQAQINYVEKMIEWAELSKATEELKPFLKEDNGLNQPLAKKWSEEYIQQALGNNPSELGRSLDSVFQTFGKVSGIGSTNLGKVPRAAKQIINGVLLGFANVGYLAMNLIEVFKSTPAMMEFLKSRGIDKSFDMGTGYKYLGKALTTAFNDLAGGAVKDYQAGALKYAKENHVYSSDLFDSSNLAYKGFEHYYDKAARLGASSVEMRTRQMAYLAYVELLHENGVRGSDLYHISQKLTDIQMGNYSHMEAPRAYATLGGIGKTAYNLMSFKHNEYSRMALLAREIAKEGNAKPLLMQLASSVAFAGILGTTLYSEADSMVKWLTSHTDNPTSLTKLLLDNPEISDYLKYGIGNGAGLDLTSRMGTGPLVPQSITDAIMPGSGKLVNIAKATAQAVTNPNEYNVKLALKEALPNSVSGILERAWFSPTDKDGNELSMNKNKVVANAERNTADKVWKTLGMTGINEAQQKSLEYENSNIDKVFTDRRNNILLNASKKLFTSGKFPAEFAQKYINAQGNPASLEREITQMQLEQQIPAAQLMLLKNAATQNLTTLHKVLRRTGNE